MVLLREVSWQRRWQGFQRTRWRNCCLEVRKVVPFSPAQHLPLARPLPGAALQSPCHRLKRSCSLFCVCLTKEGAGLRSQGRTCLLRVSLSPPSTRDDAQFSRICIFQFFALFFPPILKYLVLNFIYAVKNSPNNRNCTSVLSVHAESRNTVAAFRNTVASFSL